MNWKVKPKFLTISFMKELHVWLEYVFHWHWVDFSILPRNPFNIVFCRIDVSGLKLHDQNKGLFFGQLNLISHLKFFFNILYHSIYSHLRSWNIFEHINDNPRFLIIFLERFNLQNILLQICTSWPRKALSHESLIFVLQ